jgi:hypothetical protein
MRKHAGALHSEERGGAFLLGCWAKQAKCIPPLGHLLDVFLDAKHCATLIYGFR